MFRGRLDIFRRGFQLRNNLFVPNSKNVSLPFQQPSRKFFGMSSLNMSNAEPKSLTELCKRSPITAIQIIEKGWASRTLPVNEETLNGYMYCLDKLKLTRKFNSAAFLKSLTASMDPAAAAAATGGVEFPAGVGGILAAGHGATASNPVYVKQLPISIGIGDRVWTVVKWVGGVFFFTAILMMIFDDKGISSKLQQGSAVHIMEKSDRSFNDIVGVDEAKEELQEIVTYLKNPEKFTRLGGKLPKGVLLTGPPGTGKTLLARAIAGEAGVPFFYTSGSEFEEMFVGVGAKRVRDLFAQANSKSPCIIFIDEIDAIGGARQLKDQSALKMTLNQLLVEMDGFKPNNGVIVIGATNFPDSLDTALTRPGRLDKHINVPLPDIAGRKAILELYAKKVPVAEDVDLEQIARGTPGFSGAELANLMNEAALKCSIDGAKQVGMKALEYARDKILMGPERASAVLSPGNVKKTAFHEAGHALVSLKTEGANPIHKATIIPRGNALGLVAFLADGDETSLSRKRLLAELDVAMAGRIAEELLLGAENVTTGASNDFMQATRLATRMVTQWGFSHKLGVQSIDLRQDNISPETKNVIDEEVRTLLNDSYTRAKHLLTNHRSELEKLAAALMEYETLSGHEVANIVNGVAVDPNNRTYKPSRELEQISTMRFGAARKKEKEAAAQAGNGAKAPVPVPVPVPVPAGGPKDKHPVKQPVVVKEPVSVTGGKPVATASPVPQPAPATEVSSKSGLRGPPPPSNNK